VLAAPKLFQPARSALLDAKDDDAGWEGLVERVRSSVSALCEPVGVEAVVHAELQGLAPPSSKLRQNVLKIAQEAAANALRESAPRSLAITLRRADGGLLMEFVDDGEETEAARARRGVAGLKGRVTPLGGSAELRRADDGWLVRVKLPCEQLN
jgi:signal transduction histidine kinase